MRPPHVLVAYASRHEATAEIAAVIAGELDAAGCVATVTEARRVASLADVDAAIVGSALYVGRWDESALDFLRHERAALARIPTWLFSSGPVGEGKATAHPERLPQPADVAALARGDRGPGHDLRRPRGRRRGRVRPPDHDERRPRR